MKNIVTQSYEETQQLGVSFANTLRGGEVIALYGNLGSGKTTFMQGLAQGLGIKRNIISPTFILMRSYALEEKNKGIRHLYHVDLYRIENEGDVEGLGLLDMIADGENVVAIEWPEKIEKILPKNKIDIYFKYLEGDKRQIEFA